VGRATQPSGTPAVLQQTAASAEPDPTKTGISVEIAAEVTPASSHLVRFNILFVSLWDVQDLQ
jgi:hypothetical protein